jgi:hypothetical protein
MTLDIGKSRIHGVGLVAKIDFNEGDEIIPLEGPKHEITDEDWIKPKYDNWFGTGMYEFIEPTNELYYINHSCDPNAGFDDSFVLRPIRPIKAGEEITFDYATLERVILWRMRCRCRSERCRDIVSSVQMIPESVYQDYGALIPVFFRRCHESYYARVCGKNYSDSISGSNGQH